jgi:hypothetical protein
MYRSDNHVYLASSWLLGSEPHVRRGQIRPACYQPFLAFTLEAILENRDDVLEPLDRADEISV